MDEFPAYNSIDHQELCGSYYSQSSDDLSFGAKKQQLQTDKERQGLLQVEKGKCYGEKKKRFPRDTERQRLLQVEKGKCYDIISLY